MSGDETLYLVWHAAPEAEVELGEDRHALSPGLFMARSARSRRSSAAASTQCTVSSRRNQLTWRRA